MAVVFGLLLQNDLEAAAHDVCLIGVVVRRLPTADPIELDLGESVDDPPHHRHAREPWREHVVERRRGVGGGLSGILDG